MKTFERISRSLGPAGLLACALTLPAQAGGIISGGGRIISHEVNPWFLGTAPATYCVEQDVKTFSLPASEAVAEVREAFDDWTRTLQRLVTTPTPFRFLDGETKDLTKSFVYQPACTTGTDVRVLLGVMNDDVRKTISESPNGFVSFAKRLAYDEAAGRSQGYIWVIPDLGPDSYMKKNASFWTKPGTLKNVLLHEVGHIAGFGHAASSSHDIMSEFFPHGTVERALKGKNGKTLSTSSYLVRQLGITGGEHCNRFDSLVSWDSAADAVAARVLGPKYPSPGKSGRDGTDKDQHLLCVKAERTSESLGSTQFKIVLRAPDRTPLSEVAIESRSGHHNYGGQNDIYGLFKSMDMEIGFRPYSFTHFGRSQVIGVMQGTAGPINTILNVDDEGIQWILIDGDRVETLDLNDTPAL